MKNAGELEVTENGFGMSLTKREYFAAMAMQGILADGGTSDIRAVVQASIMISEALLKQLEDEE